MKADGRVYWSSSLSNPFYLALKFSFNSTIVVTPVCYAVIYKYLLVFSQMMIHSFEFGKLFLGLGKCRIKGLMVSAAQQKLGGREETLSQCSSTCSTGF